MRSDEYFVSSDNSEIGIKRRDVRTESPLSVIEIKGLVDVIEPGVALYNGNAGFERWIKWTCSGIDLSAGCSLHVNKTRWLRKFSICGQIVTEIPLNRKEKPADATVALPLEGCNVELTKVTWDEGRGAEWFTVGFEAFGALGSVELNLRQTSEHLKLRTLLGLSTEHLMNYPKWLRMLTNQ